MTGRCWRAPAPNRRAAPVSGLYLNTYAEPDSAPLSLSDGAPTMTAEGPAPTDQPNRSPAPPSLAVSLNASRHPFALRRNTYDAPALPSSHAPTTSVSALAATDPPKEKLAPLSGVSVATSCHAPRRRSNT